MEWQPAMKKPYEAHEIAYRRMREKGIGSWDQFSRSRKEPDIAPSARRFLIDALAMPWAPKTGKATELGCGTGPMLRWICKRGFSGLGVDVSRTAIAMARDQSKGLDIRFRQADLCSFHPREAGTFDLAIDGHCLHCITTPAGRNAFLRTARRLLKPGGVFIVQTMCGPVDRTLYARTRGRSLLVGRTIYVAAPGAGVYEGSTRIRGQLCQPTRYIEHWRRILTDIRAAGFRPRMVRYLPPYDDCFTGDLSIGAVAV
jgi:SAM-dependent methyltransferase